MTVHTSLVGAVLTVTVDRPDALNAVDFETMAGLEGALDLAEASPECRVVVLTGAGRRCFISGGDLRKFAELRADEDVRAMALRMSEILNRLERLDAWVVASVNGSAFGGGCETALACDFRIASEAASFGFTQARFAVPPGWGGLTRLIEVVGKPTALWWLARAAIVDARTAHAAGLVQEVVAVDELDAATRALAEHLARSDRRLINALKKGARRAHELARGEAMQQELEPFVTCWVGEDHHEAIEAFLSRKD